jgi:riboflavin kinase/FMN adenylyltransferase
MDVITGWREVPSSAKGAVLAIGNFDGVHRGHQAVLGQAIARARNEGRRSGAVIFEPHPRQFFAPDEPFFRLTPLPIKLELFDALGLDQTIVIDFDADLAALRSESFAREVIAGGLDASAVVVGYDFTYGKGRTGSPDELKSVGAPLGFDVEVVQPVAVGGAVFSSSRVRDHLSKGEIAEAADLLGYWWRVQGRVARGEGRGKGLGFPTINLELMPGQDVGHGIYAMRVHHDGRRDDAAGYIGSRPTFGGGRPVLEAYLLDFAGDLYGAEVEVEFIAKIRGDMSFATPAELAKQMSKDCDDARVILDRINASDPLRKFPVGRALADADSFATGLS